MIGMMEGGTVRFLVGFRPMTKANQEPTGLTGKDKSQGDLQGGEKELPEGLKRERKGPLDKNVGRENDNGGQ